MSNTASRIIGLRTPALLKSRSDADTHATTAEGEADYCSESLGGRTALVGVGTSFECEASNEMGTGTKEYIFSSPPFKGLPVIKYLVYIASEQTSFPGVLSLKVLFSRYRTVLVHLFQFQVVVGYPYLARVRWLVFLSSTFS